MRKRNIASALMELCATSTNATSSNGERIAQSLGNLSSSCGPSCSSSFTASSLSFRGRSFSSAAGQPVPETHPTLLGKEDLTPGITAAEYVHRRSKLASFLSQGDVAIVPAAAQQFVAGIIPYPYRQDADFSYLTGIRQQAACIVQSTGPEGDPGHRYFIFVPDYDPNKEQWDGATLSTQAAVDLFQAHEAHPLSQLGGVMGRLGAQRIFYDPERNPSAPLHRDVPALRQAMEGGRCRPLRPFLQQLRWVKSPAEVQLMRRSAQLAAGALKACMSYGVPGASEHQLAALFEFQCRMGGAQRLAYPSVVASGCDATTIHYSRNDKTLREGDMILMDAGCELHGYSSDVTRTWPINGRYSSAQRDLYEVVLSVHRSCLALCIPGNTLRDIHHRSVGLLCEGLRQLGIAGSKSALDIMRAGLYRTFYPHTLGHWLGLDVHDCALLGQDPRLRPGVVMTVEPGLYIPDSERYGHFRGLGVRIEDDVLITAGPPEILSGDVPVEVAEIEGLIKAARTSPNQTGRLVDFFRM